MKRLLIFLGLVAALALATDPVSAQQTNLPYDVDIASGSDGTCTTTGPASDQLTTCSDLRPGTGVSKTNPGADASTKETTKPPPADDTATDSVPESSDTTVASAGDLDADNAPDESEPGLGLDPSNPDTDADNVADGDEMNIYGTDPTNPDSDGDGATDGAELFGSHTDPLVMEQSATGGEETVADS